jgi:hypothetical protein
MNKRALTLLMLLFVATTIAYGQKKTKKEEPTTADEVYGDKDPDFQVKDIPEKWKGESAVIIAQKANFIYRKRNSGLEGEEMVRKRIKLLDKAAVEEFSQFYFMDYGDSQEIGIRITKPNGTQVDVDTTHAVKVTSSVSIPSIFQSYYAYYSSYKKLAVPNLEVGDIIDFFYYTYDKSSSDYFHFTLSSTYPTMSQKFYFMVDPAFSINFNSYNGAPKLVAGGAGTDWKGRVNEKIKTYTLVDKDRPRLKKENWDYQFRHEPSVKFQVFFINGALASKSTEFFNEDNTPKTSVDKKEVAESVDILLDQATYDMYSKDIIKYLDKNYKDENDDLKFATLAYYYFRYLYLTQEISYDGRMEHRYDLGDYKYRRMSDEYFFKVFDAVLTHYEIQYDVIATVNRNNGTIDDLLLWDELVLGFRVAGEKGTFFYPFDIFNSHETNNYNIDGTDAYAYQMFPSSKETIVNRVKLPTTNADQNKISTTSSISFDENMELLKIARETQVTGMYKPSYSAALIAHDYVVEEELRIDPKFEDIAPGTTQKKRDEAKRIKDTHSEEAKKAELEEMKSLAEEDFEIQSYDKFELVQSGRMPEKPVMIFKESMQAKNMVNKAGKNYMLEVGKLIGDQVKLEESDMKREHDIYMQFARSTENQITIEIPAGYTVDGLNDLNVNIDNASGKFVSTATLNGNKLVIKTQKAYKKAYDKKESWSQMVTFLDAAYKFSQKKVLLKKA